MAEWLASCGGTTNTDGGMAYITRRNDKHELRNDVQGW